MKMFIPAIALLSSTVMAADFKVNAEGRFDYVNSTTKHEAVTATNNYEEKRSDFQTGTVRFNAVATFSENLSFRARYRVGSIQTETFRDGTVGNLDLFFVDHKTSMFTARLGKQAQAELVGRETFVSGTDFLINSKVYTTINSDVSIYRTGASLIFSQIEDQTFTLNASVAAKSETLPDSSGDGNDSKNNGMGYGVYYNGKFAGKLFQPTIGYTMNKIDAESDAGAANTSSATNKLLAVGFRSEVAGFTIDADFKNYKKPTTAVIGAASNATKTDSIYTNIAYSWNEYTPFVTYVNDKFDSEVNTADYKRNAFAVGLMIKPIKDLNFRYHLVYINDVTKTDGATTATDDKKLTANKFVAGIKFDI